jgi:hypothetical protein
VLSGRIAIYIVVFIVFWGNYDYYCRGDDPGFKNGIHVVGSCVQKGVELYGKYDYYLIYNEKIVRSGGVTYIFSLSKSQVEKP